MKDAKFLIPNLIVESNLTVYAAPANGGKSALFRYFCEQLCLDGLNVIYINVDAGPSDLKKHHDHAERHGYKVIATDAHVGKSSTDVLDILKKMAESDIDLRNSVFVLDTLKKFVDVINKSKSKEFFQLLRKLTVKGATICLLGHCNKYKDDEGRYIYEGTGDLRADIDHLIYFDSSLNESTNILEVTTKPDKARANFKPVSFHIDRNNGLKVTPVDRLINILPPEDRYIIDLCKQAIADGHHNQGEIISYVKERCEAGEKKIKGKLKFYSTCHNPELTVRPTGIGKELRFSVL